MDVGTVNATIRALIEDPNGRYADDPYLQPVLILKYTELFNRILSLGSDFSEYVVELPNVPAGTPDLSRYTAQGQPLFGLMVPREIEWKLPGQDPTNYRDAEGPLEKLREVFAPGIPALDCWAYMHFNILLSLFNTPLDLRVTGDFLVPPLGASSDQLQLGLNILPPIAYEVATVIAIKRGNPQWVTNYTAHATEAWDDFAQVLVHARQGRGDRLGRATDGYQGIDYSGLIR